MKTIREDLVGVLNLCKPTGVTSRAVVNTVQRLIRPLKCGHGGTLDPIATGVLLVAVGSATRLISMLQQGTKVYHAGFTLGQVSDTDDSTGVIQQRYAGGPVPDEHAIRVCLQKMTGIVSQVPPAYSAVHIDGQRAYDLARRGEKVAPKARDVAIHSIRILRYQWPQLKLEISCGSGTYIRSIARDLGELLEVGGLMHQLERTRVGSFTIEDSISADSLTRENITELLCPAINIVADLPKFDCGPEQIAALSHGRTIPVGDEHSTFVSELQPGQTVALTRTGFTELLALAELMPGGALQPRIVLSHF